ncbi:hypothetical protein SAMN05444161_6711 [Rhizobiales bacterium GAS191]|nr:hypothetical protein SAMN05444161_6711 [Rhizobiales bacterium GAS191]SEF00711.1 hypothetical protein SAMN05519104_7683 [Rhizobiales bacterium GAS188]
MLALTVSDIVEGENSQADQLVGRIALGACGPYHQLDQQCLDRDPQCWVLTLITVICGLCLLPPPGTNQCNAPLILRIAASLDTAPSVPSLDYKWPGRH